MGCPPDLNMCCNRYIPVRTIDDIPIKSQKQKPKPKPKMYNEPPVKNEKIYNKPPVKNEKNFDVKWILFLIICFFIIKL